MISIIIPTLNEASVLEKTLKGFRAGVRHRVELIVSDGGSTDGTLLVADKFADKVVRWGSTERQTIALGRNLGAAEATGEYLVFFDADVIVPDPDAFFDEARAVFERRKKVVALTGALRVVRENETFSDRFFFGLINCSYFILNNLLGIGAASGEFQMIRRDIFEKLGGYRKDLAVAEDQELFRRLARAGRTYFCSKLVVYHTGRRIHKVGWPKILSLWAINGLFVPLFGRSFSKEWKEVR